MERNSATPNVKGRSVDPKTDYSAWQFWFAVAQGIITAAVAVYAWLCNCANARQKDMEEVREAMTCIGTRVTKLENCTISHRELGAVYDRINAVSKQVSKMDGKMDAIAGAVDMIQEHLLSSGGDR